MIFCLCRRISDREIFRHARARMGFDEVQLDLGCGNAMREVRRLRPQCRGAVQRKLPLCLILVIGSTFWGFRK